LADKIDCFVLASVKCSIAADAVFCFPCRQFISSTTAYKDTAFTETGKEAGRKLKKNWINTVLPVFMLIVQCVGEI